MTDQLQKAFPKMSEKDRQFDKLLSDVFQMLSTQRPFVRTDTAGSKLNRKPSSTSGVMPCK